MQSTITDTHNIERQEPISSIPAITPSGGKTGSRTLVLVDRLCKSLASENIIYCHWKSNPMIDRSATGENDLDLLIDRADANRFTQLLCQLGFKLFLSPPGFDVPGIQNYFGYDLADDVIVHVHAHYQLILGHDLYKNYHIPIEQAYLASSVQGELFRLPALEFEFVIFVIRMMIKHFMWDTLLGRQRSMSRNERHELDYLSASAQTPEVHRLLVRYLPGLEIGLFDDCVRVLQSRCPIWFILKTSQKLQVRMKAFAQEPYLVNAGHKILRRLVTGIRSRVFQQHNRRKSANAGLLVAIVGGDGAGKTTALNNLSQWISPHFDTTRFHLGKPAWSWLTITIRGILKLISIFSIVRASSKPKPRPGYQPLNEFPGYSSALRAVCTAYDRVSTYTRARRVATNGGIVLCDRFPIPKCIQMDGPQVERMLASRPKNRFLQHLHRMELSLYNQIMLPDLLIVLRLDPDMAVNRKVEEDRDFIHARSSLIWQTEWDGTNAIVLDASLPADSVLAEIKALVWSRL